MNHTNTLETNNETMIKKWKRNIPLDYIDTFIGNLNMQSCVWVLYLAFRGMNLAQIGILEGIYHAVSIVCEVPSGAMADLLGRKKCMLISRVLIAVSCVIMLFGNNFWWFALSFGIQALGNNMNSGSEEALIYDSMKAVGNEDAYMGVYGRLNVIIEVSQQIATVVGGILAEVSFAYCYGASLVIGCLAIVPVIFMEEVPTNQKLEVSVPQLIRQHFKTSFDILKEDRRILKIIVFYAVVFTGHTLLFFYSQQYFSDLGYNKIQLSFIMLVVGLVSCAGALLSEKLYEKLGKKMAYLGAFGIAFAFLCYGANNLWISMVSFGVASFCNSMLYPVQSESLNELIPSEQRATLISINSMFFSIGMIVLFPLAGALADVFGLTRILVAIGVLLAALVVVFCLRKEAV
ncbi:MAG: MFS transporter [Agathobacter sp.]|nr:MFS transporter [Agathobacter sp.]